MITYGKWKTIPTSCTTCGRNSIEARPVYETGIQIQGWEHMEYRCKCGYATVYTNKGQYDLWKLQNIRPDNL